MNSDAGLFPFARQLHEWGANITAIMRGGKRPGHKWQQWQTERQTVEELEQLPWSTAAALGVVNGSGDFRFFDIDPRKDANGTPLEPVPEAVLVTALRAIGLPADYQWSYRSGSGAGWGFVIRCADPLPEALATTGGIVTGRARAGLAFDHLELRWSSGQTVIHGAHPTGPGYRWRLGDLPFVPPVLLTAERVAAAFFSIAEVEPPAERSAQLPVEPQRTNGRYGQAALNDAIRQVSTAAPGTRNNTLFPQTASLAELVNGGELTRAEVERAMTAAALAAGLTQQETAATIESAFRKVTASRAAPVRVAANGRSAHNDPPDDAPAWPDFRDYHPEDGGLLDAWLDTRGPDWIYIAEQREWHRWAETHWQPDPAALALKCEFESLMKHINTAARDALATAAQDEAGRFKAYIQATRRTGARLGSIEQLAQVRRHVSLHQVNCIDGLNLQNGTLDLRTLALRPHEREDWLTYCLPYAYDPDAVAPVWERVVGRLAPDVAAFLQEFAGYALTIDTQHEVAVWLYGPPGGGKSTFLAGLQAMLGSQALSLGLADVLNNRFALARLPGKTLAIATEQPADYLATTHVLNALISGEPIVVDRKFRDAIELRPVAKLAWAMNDLPRMKGGNDGLFRRVKIVEFPALDAGERQTNFKEAVIGEAPGILNWALAGLQRLRQRGRFEVPEEISAATAEFARQNDIPALFLEESCERSADYEVATGVLYDAYKEWCEENGHRSLSSTAAAGEWKRLELVKDRTAKQRVWRGARLIAGPRAQAL